MGNDLLLWSRHILSISLDTDRAIGTKTCEVDSFLLVTSGLVQILTRIVRFDIICIWTFNWWGEGIAYGGL